MTRDVAVEMTSRRFDAASLLGEISLQATGLYGKDGDTHLLYYEAEEIEGELPVKNKLRFDEKLVDLKKASVGGLTELLFREDTVHTTWLRTGFGNMPLGIATKSISVTEEENCITLRLSYDMLIEGDPMEQTELTLIITPAQTKETNHE